MEKNFTKHDEMIEAAESDVQIILSVKEGKGFEEILQPTFLVGTLNGYSLETDRVDSCPNPQYEIDLVWETNKTILRRLRSGQVPLKLECFAFKENGDKEKLGYVLLSIRSAQVICQQRNLNIKASWHKLLGLRSDLKMHKPELLLTLIIEDKKSSSLHPTVKKCQEIELYKTSSGNIEKFNSNNNSDEEIHATECNNVNKHIGCQCLNCQMDKITHSSSYDAMLCNCSNKNHIKSTQSYHCYCLHISIVGITSVSATFSNRQIDFRVHHPKAEVTSAVHLTMPVAGETIKLHESGCQFHFISTPDEIKQLLSSFPPKISMHDTNKNSGPLSLLVLNLKSLFDQDKPEHQQTVSLYDTDQNTICEIDIMLKLEDRGLHFILKKEISRKNLGPPILDDSLAYKIVDELETWKERQKEMFKFEMKKKEERHLNLLSEEWQKQKETLESKLACSVEQCKILAASLKSATEDLKTRRLKSLDNETRLIKANEELQWRYEIKMQELKDSLHAVQIDLTAKVAKLEENKAALEAQLKVLSCENENLKLSINKQMNELRMYQKESLTQDQTTSSLQEVKLLEEKLENARRGKLFFKEQWAKAVREIHRMKVDYQQAMQVHIKNSKEELKNVELAEILSFDTKALNNDQILLNELQKEVNTIKPKQYYDFTESDTHIYTPTDTIFKICYNNNKTLSHKSEEYNERLQTLREERDSLLKTGSYAPDDVVIKKLNKEIGALLVRK